MIIALLLINAMTFWVKSNWSCLLREQLIWTREFLYLDSWRIRIRDLVIEGDAWLVCTSGFDDHACFDSFLKTELNIREQYVAQVNMMKQVASSTSEKIYSFFYSISIMYVCGH